MAHSADYEFLDSRLFGSGKTGGLACGGEDTEEICSILQLVFDKFDQRLLVDAAIGAEGGDQGDAQSFEYVVDHIDYYVFVIVTAKLHNFIVKPLFLLHFFIISVPFTFFSHLVQPILQA